MSELQRLMDAAANHRMTDRERWLQRVSFAYGNAAIDNPDVTRETVEREAAAIYGPCPPQELP